MTTIATIKGLRTIRYIPQPGEHQLSINLGSADAATVFEFATELGVKPEIVQIPTNSGIEIHALLLQEQADHSPLVDESDLSAKLDELAARINADAIRHVYGRRLAHASRN
jgi:hypothetical protein